MCGGNYATGCVHLPEAEPDAPVKQEFKEEMLMNDEEAPEGDSPEMVEYNRQYYMVPHAATVRDYGRSLTLPSAARSSTAHAA